MTKFQSLVKTIVLPAVCLFSVCLVTTAMLAYTNEITAPVIKANTQLTAEENYRAILTTAQSFETRTYSYKDTEYSVQVGMADGKPIGYIFQNQHNGYGGPVVVLTGIDSSGTILGVKILELQETPGLGMKAREPEFIDQFTNKKGGLKVIKSETKNADEIQAISGATITSNSVTASVNLASEIFDSGKEVK